MKEFLGRKFIFDNRGVISPLILVGAVVLIALFIILGNLPIRDKLFGSLFPKNSSHAAGATVDVNLLPANANVAPNSTFTVSVAISPQAAAVSGTTADLTFDPAKLQATDIKIGTSLAQPLDPCTFQLGVCSAPFTDAIKYTDSSKTTQTGNIHFSVGAKTGDPFVTTPVVIATITFKALAVTTAASQITLNASATSVAGADPATGQAIPGDIKGTLTSSAITIASSAVNPTAKFSLSPATSTAAGNVEFPVQVKVQSDTDSGNLFVAKLNFDATKLQVSRIDATGSFVTQWADQSFDNSGGKVSLVGGVPTPGLKTSGSAVTEAIIFFKGTVAGTSTISFDGTSAVYRDSDNVNILNIATSTGASATITSTASPSPSVAPSPSPSASVAPSPSAGASAQPSPSASVAPSPSASVLPSPSGSGTSACTVTQASWVTAANPTTEGKVVALSVTGSGNCAGKSVSFTVLEDDGVFGTDPTKNNPPTATFNSSNTAATSWLAEFQQDGALGIDNPPEYYFQALISGNSAVQSSSPELQVNPLAAGQSLTGDFNKDGLVDLVDLSIMLSNWNKVSNFRDELDLNSDGAINSADWATMLQILRIGGIIH